LHELGAARDFQGEGLVPARAPREGGEPAVHARVLVARAVRDRAERTEQRQQPDAEVPEDGRGLDLLSEGRTAVGPAPFGPAREGRDEPVGQDAVDLVEVRLEEVGDDDLASRRAFLPSDPLEPARARLELGDTDRVLVRHPDGQVTGDDARQLGIARERREPLEIALGIAPILVVDKPGDRLLKRRPQLGGELRDPPLEVGVQRRARRGGGGGGGPGGGGFGGRGPPPPPPLSTRGGGGPGGGAGGGGGGPHAPWPG